MSKPEEIDDVITRLRYAYEATGGHTALVRRNDLRVVLDAFDEAHHEIQGADDLQRRIDSLTALLAQSEADNKAWAERCRWIPVGERLPPEGEWVLVWSRGVPLIGCRYTTAHWTRQDGGEGPGLRTTHWRPLDPGPDAT